MNSRTKVLVTRWVVTVVMGLAVVGIAAACKINKEKKVEPETSEIYKLFAGREDLRVTFLKDEEIAEVKRPLTAEEIENVQNSAKNYAALAGLT